MATYLRIYVIICIALFPNMSAFASSEEWTTATTKDGKITAKYHISTQTDENGSSRPFISYIVTTTGEVSMESVISVIKNISNHKDLHNDQYSKKIKSISENEWLLYYYNKGPWPLPDSDNVVIMAILENEKEKTVVFELNAAPLMYGSQGVRRMSHFKETITLKDLENGHVKITVATEMIPPMKVPNWILRSSFPEVAYDVVRKVVKLAIASTP